MSRELIYKDEAVRAVLKQMPSVAWCINTIKPVDMQNSLRISKELFCECARIYKEYGKWETQLYGMGIDITGSPPDSLAGMCLTLMCHGDNEWAYDRKLGTDWICEWAFNDHDFEQHRHGREFIIDSAGALYDFIVFMNKYGWED